VVVVAEKGDVAWGLHLEKIREFQHERLVHLLVTLFFGAVMFGAFAWRASIQDFFDGSGFGIFANVATGFLCVALVITMLLYVRHYYKLENGIQKLYEYTEKIYKKGLAK
jgi:uncharacterized membrane protein